MIDNHVCRCPGKQVQERISALKIGQKMQDLPDHLWHDSFRFYVKEDPNRVGGPNLRLIRLDPAKPSLTVTGYIYNKFVHPYEDRFVTVREAARLQGFPDEFIFQGSLTSTQMQVGNAVPVPLGCAVFSQILSHAVKINPFGICSRHYSKEKKFPAISLFSGAGGLDVALEKSAQGEFRYLTKAAIEYDHDCCETLRKNFPKNLKVIENDIRKIDPSDLLKQVSGRVGTFPLIYGGPPCQAFSQAGKQKGVSDERGVLVFEFLRFLETIRPIYFLMENVSGIKGIDKGNLLRRILYDMDSIGYNVTHGILCAADYGTPQLRNRFVFMGVQKEFPSLEMPIPTHCKITNDGFLFNTLKPYVSVGEAFKGLPTINNGTRSFVTERTKRINGKNTV